MSFVVMVGWTTLAFWTVLVLTAAWFATQPLRRRIVRQFDDVFARRTLAHRLAEDREVEALDTLWELS